MPITDTAPINKDAVFEMLENRIDSNTSTKERQTKQIGML